MKPGAALKSEFLLEDTCHRICCFLFFFQHLSQSFWLLLFVVNQLYSQKRSPKFSKAKFRSKTVSTIIAPFFLLSTSFPIDLWKIAEKMWCSKKKWHFWVFTATERRSFWCFWRNVTKSDLWVFQRRSSMFVSIVDHQCLSIAIMIWSIVNRRSLINQIDRDHQSRHQRSTIMAAYLCSGDYIGMEKFSELR